VGRQVEELRRTVDAIGVGALCAFRERRIALVGVTPMVAVNENAVADLGKEVRDWLEGFDRDAALVAVPVFNAYEDVLECVTSLLASTPAGVPILVIDDASSDDRISQA